MSRVLYTFVDEITVQTARKGERYGDDTVESSPALILGLASDTWVIEGDDAGLRALAQRILDRLDAASPTSAANANEGEGDESVDYTRDYALDRPTY